MPLSPVYGRHLYFLASFGNLISILRSKPPNLALPFLYSLILPLRESTFCELQTHLYSQPPHLFAPADDLLPSKVSVSSVVLQVETSYFFSIWAFPSAYEVGVLLILHFYFHEFLFFFFLIIKALWSIVNDLRLNHSFLPLVGIYQIPGHCVFDNFSL